MRRSIGLGYGEPGRWRKVVFRVQIPFEGDALPTLDSIGYVQLHSITCQVRDVANAYQEGIVGNTEERPGAALDGDALVFTVDRNDALVEQRHHGRIHSCDEAGIQPVYLRVETVAGVEPQYAHQTDKMRYFKVMEPSRADSTS